MQLLENDIQSHQDHIDDIMSRVRRFRDNNHFQIDFIEDRGRELVAKWVLMVLKRPAPKLTVLESIDRKHYYIIMLTCVWR